MIQRDSIYQLPEHSLNWRWDSAPTIQATTIQIQNKIELFLGPNAFLDLRDLIVKIWNFERNLNIFILLWKCITLLLKLSRPLSQQKGSQPMLRRRYLLPEHSSVSLKIL